VTEVYLAARYTRREELCDYRAELQARGFEVPARWLHGSHQMTDQGMALGALEAAVEDPDGVSLDQARTIALREKFALDDFEDVTRADLIVAFTEAPRQANSRGGRHVEFGIALGRGTPVIIVGPRENIFTCLPWVKVYASWLEAKQDPRLKSP
jgi:hypothetical protein